MRQPAVLLAVAVLLACERPTDAAPSPTSTATTAGDAATSASSAPPALAHPQQGSWSAKYEAVKAEVDVPAGVRWPHWADEAADDGVGAGDISITVDPSGRVLGTVSGALGELQISGVIEDGALSAWLEPSAAPDATPALSGVMHGGFAKVGAGEPGVGAIDAELRVSSENGNMVRKASAKLERR
jgi:hypothetical protein